jgi:hypothetical protein
MSDAAATRRYEAGVDIEKAVTSIREAMRQPDPVRQRRLDVLAAQKLRAAANTLDQKRVP